MSGKNPTPTVRALRRAITMGRLEAAANEEYRKGKYHPERGGPAMKRLRDFRNDKRRTTTKESK